MACRTIRSEYMKKFKDPKWETFRKCYEEMLIYRISRRILEQAHIPWFWNGQDDSDSESVEIKQTPSAGQNQVEAEQVHCGGAKTIPRLLLQEEQENELSVRKTTGKLLWNMNWIWYNGLCHADVWITTSTRFVLFFFVCSFFFHFLGGKNTELTSSI